MNDSKTFDNFNVNPDNKKAYDAFRLLADGKASFSMLLCLGLTGNGKSHLLQATANQIGVRILEYPRLLRSLLHSDQCDRRRSNDGKPWVSFNENIERYSRMTYLFIDEYEMGNVKTGWEADRDAGWFEQIIVARYRMIEDGYFQKTVLITNLNLESIPERIYSRFSDSVHGKIVLNEAPDYRKKK